MVLDHPAASRHLPASIKVGDGSESGEKRIHDGKAAEDEKEATLETGIVGCRRA